jgi:hypothetical protein
LASSNVDNTDVNADTVVLVLDGVLTLIDPSITSSWNINIDDQIRLDEEQNTLNALGEVLLRAKKDVLNTSNNIQNQFEDIGVAVVEEDVIPTAYVNPLDEFIDIERDKADIMMEVDYTNIENNIMSVEIEEEMNVIDSEVLDSDVLVPSVMRNSVVSVSEEVTFNNEIEGSTFNDISIVSLNQIDSTIDEDEISSNTVDVTQDQVVDTLAEEQETKEDQIMNLLIGSIDVFFFLIEALVRSTGPILSV